MREADPGAALRRLIERPPKGLRRKFRAWPMIPARGAAIVRVKICGVTNWPDARLAVDLGARCAGI